MASCEKEKGLNSIITSAMIPETSDDNNKTLGGHTSEDMNLVGKIGHTTPHHHQRPALEDSTGTCYGVGGGGGGGWVDHNGPGLNQADDLKGTFIVVTPSMDDDSGTMGEEAEEAKEGGVGRNLTLTVCRSPVNSVRDEIDGVTIGEKVGGRSDAEKVDGKSDVGEMNGQSDVGGGNGLFGTEEVSTQLDGEEISKMSNIVSQTAEIPGNRETFDIEENTERNDETIDCGPNEQSDTDGDRGVSQVVVAKLETHGNRSTSTSSSGAAMSGTKLRYPVVIIERDEGEADDSNEPAERNNEVVESSSSHRRRVASTRPSDSVVSPAEGERGPEQKHSTADALTTNRSPLSSDKAAANWNQPGRRRAAQSARATPTNHRDKSRSNTASTGERIQLSTSITNTNNSSTKHFGNSLNGSNRAAYNNYNKSPNNYHRDTVKTNLQRNHNNNNNDSITSSTSRSRDNKLSSTSIAIGDFQNGFDYKYKDTPDSDKQRSVSVFEQRYTKGELRSALPRRSFFSCHDRALKDAGLGTDDPVAKKKAERLRARLEKIANEFTPLSTATTEPLTLTVNKESGDINNYTSIENGVINVDFLDNATATNANKSDHNEEIEIVTAVADTVFIDHETHLGVGETSGDAKHDPTKLSVSRAPKKKRPGSARSERIDCKPLLHYLEYVRDNKEEYVHHLHASFSSSKTTKSTSRLITMGKAFELRDLGGIPRRHDDDVIVMAAKALRPRTSDSSKYARHNKDRMSASSSVHSQDPTMRQGRPMSEDKRKLEKNNSATHAHTLHSKDDEHAKTEMERRRIRAEDWSKSVSTNTLTKAKLQSLRELGADDDESAKWWEAFRDCRYLRDTWPVTEGVV